MSDLAELIKAERSAANLAGYFDNSNGTGRDYLDAQMATDAAIAELAAQVVPQPNQEALRGAIGNVLCNVMNYPESVQARLLGTDTAPLTAKVTDAVIAHLSAQPVAGEVEWEEPTGYTGFWTESRKTHFRQTGCDGTDCGFMHPETTPWTRCDDWNAGYQSGEKDEEE